MELWETPKMLEVRGFPVFFFFKNSFYLSISFLRSLCMSLLEWVYQSMTLGRTVYLLTKALLNKMVYLGHGSLKKEILQFQWDSTG